MKSMKITAFAVLLAASAILTSCSKDDEVAVTGNASATLDAGKAGIIFNTNANFVTKTAFNVRNTQSTNASNSINGTSRTIILTAIELSAATAVRAASISITLPATATTSQGNLVADLSVPGTATIIASVTLISNSGSTAGTSYDSESGTLTITKLTATEIEGTFNGTVTSGATAYVISNGSFAGKFN